MSSKRKYHNTSYSGRPRIDYTIGEKVFHGLKNAFDRVSNNASAIYETEEKPVELIEDSGEISDKQANSMLEPADD